MKHFLPRFLVISLVFLFYIQGFAQESPLAQTEEPPKIFVIVKNDGTRFYGNILSQDAREVLIETKELGQVYIPRHEIREIREVTASEMTSRGTFIPSEVFSTRYFITTNGLPVEKGETYALWSLIGPDFQFGVSENVGLGIMTTWIGSPIIGTFKYSIPINEKWNAGVGLLAGTGSWSWPDFALALPFGVISYGDRIKNINFSLGYAGITYVTEHYHHWDAPPRKERQREGNLLFSFAGMVKVGATLSLVFDSFIMPRTGTEEYTYWNYVYNPETDTSFEVKITETRKRHGITILIPGLRFQTNTNSAFQFGFAGMHVDGEFLNVPLPMIQYFRKL